MPLSLKWVGQLAPIPKAEQTCVCGHLYAAHDHYKDGSWCAVCATADADGANTSACPKFRPQHRWAWRRP